MTRLRTTYLGLELRSPLVASASPLTRELDSLRRLEEAGAAAVVLPSLFEEQIAHEALELDRLMDTGAESFGEALGYFPALDDHPTGPDRYLELVQEAKGALSIPVIASLNGTTAGGWVHHAKLIEEAGADALELNVYLIATDPDHTAADVERRYLELVGAVRETIEIPLAVKLGPYFSAFAHMARELDGAGADALVLFNRFYQPDIDLETLAVAPHLVLSTSDELRLPLRWIALLHGRVGVELAATTGVHTAQDSIKALLAGAQVTMMTSALLHHGPEHLTEVEAELRAWIDEREYASVDQLRGSVSQRAIANPEAFERANYIRELTTYSSHFRAQ